MRMRGNRFGEVRAKRRKNFTEEQQNQAQERYRDCGRNAEVSRLAETAIRFVMASGMRVRHDLQQEQHRNQRQRKGGTRGQAAIPPDIC